MQPSLAISWSNFRSPSAENPEMEQGGTEQQRLNELTGRVIAACIEVHRHLGPGLLEAVSSILRSITPFLRCSLFIFPIPARRTRDCPQIAAGDLEAKNRRLSAANPLGGWSQADAQQLACVLGTAVAPDLDRDNGGAVEVSAG